MTKDYRASRKWTTLSRQVRREEPTCWLRFAGCTTVSDTADHIIPVDECVKAGRIDLIYERSNCRGACSSCNNKRGALPVKDIHHLIGAADKASTALGFFD